MEREQVKDHFRRQVHEYEELMRRIVPAYDLQARLLIELIPFDTDTPIRVLDLGSGPGTLSEMVLAAYPRSHVVAFDLTEEMLDAARTRCHRFRDRFSAVAGDYAVDDFGSAYDLILAGLTLHHLDDEQRRMTLVQVFLALSDGGAFLAREVVADDDPFIAEWHYRRWRDFMTRNGEDGKQWYQKHLAKDHPASVKRQLDWLRSAGFPHVACHWRHMNFAILSAHKSASAWSEFHPNQITRDIAPPETGTPNATETLPSRRLHRRPL